MGETLGHLPSDVRSAISRLVRENRNEGPISISRMMGEIRRQWPQASLSEDVLETAIAEQAIAAGGCIEFDRRC
jgi:hypothetical protein